MKKKFINPGSLINRLTVGLDDYDILFVISRYQPRGSYHSSWITFGILSTGEVGYFDIYAQDVIVVE